MVNQRNRVGCRPLGLSTGEERGSTATVTRRMKNEGTEPRLAVLLVEEGPCSARARSSDR